MLVVMATIAATLLGTAAGLRSPHSAGEWSAIADMREGHTINSAAALNDTLYLVGGTTGSGWNTPLAYHPASDSWTPLPPLLKPRDHQAAAALNGKVYALGGVGANANNTALQALKSVEALDPVTRMWSLSADMPTSRYYLGAAELDGKIYVVGGMETAHTGRALNSAIVYNPTSDTWSPIANMSTARCAQRQALRCGRRHRRWPWHERPQQRRSLRPSH